MNGHALPNMLQSMISAAIFTRKNYTPYLHADNAYIPTLLSIMTGLSLYYSDRKLVDCRKRYWPGLPARRFSGYPCNRPAAVLTYRTQSQFLSMKSCGNDTLTTFPFRSYKIGINYEPQVPRHASHFTFHASLSVIYSFFGSLDNRFCTAVPGSD